MRIYKWILITILLFFIVLPAPAGAQYSLDRVYYGFSGSLDAVEYLKLGTEHELDPINTLGLALVYDGAEYNLEGNWRINFLKRSHYNIGINFLFPVEMDRMVISKGLGFYGETIYLNQNRYYWEVVYLLDRDDRRWLYEGGITIPLLVNTYLNIGLGNSYWNTKGSFMLGLEVDLN